MKRLNKIEIVTYHDDGHLYESYSGKYYLPFNRVTKNLIRDIFHNENTYVAEYSSNKYTVLKIDGIVAANLWMSLDRYLYVDIYKSFYNTKLYPDGCQIWTNGIICKERSEDSKSLMEEYDAFIDHLLEKCSESHEKEQEFDFVEHFHDEEYSCSCENNLLLICDGKGYIVATCEM